MVFKGFSDVINLDLIDEQKIYDFTFGRFVTKRVMDGDHSSLRMLRASSDSSAIEILGYTQQNFTRDLLLATLVVTAFLVSILIVLLLRKTCY